MKTLVRVALGVAIAFVVVFGGMVSYLLIGQSVGRNLVIGDPDFTQMADGNYVGQYVHGRWTNQVRLQVTAGRVVDVMVLKDVRFPRPEWTRALFDTVIQRQSLQVDAISGATITSKAYLKAMENALAELRTKE